MRMISLQSGSSGNCIYVESKGVKLLFDAGISGTQLQQRLKTENTDLKSIDGLFISHDHSDHVRCAGVFNRRFEIPLYITQKTLAASERFISPQKENDVRFFKAGTSVKIGPLTVETIGTPHDAQDGVVFVVDDGENRLGIATDVGHVFSDLKSLVKSVDALFLESNFDEQMLEKGQYPYFLKKRISGPGGHISNREAADLVAQNASSKLKWLCLAHLSDKNNTKRKAMTAHREALGKTLPIHMTSRHDAIDPLEVQSLQLIFDL